MNPIERNQQVQLRRQRDGMPEVADFQMADTPMPQPNDGEALVRSIYLSLDPYIRKAIRGDHPGHRALQPGEVIYGRSVCRVVRSRHADLKPGDCLVAETGWQTYACITPKKIVQRIDPALGPLSTAVGVLGMPGLTAWGSVTHAAAPKIGDTYVVSAAAGPVGGTVGQLAKLAGARVVGIAGGKEKCDVALRTYGFDACVDYKKDGWEQALQAACPNGIDIYHDNVGAPLLSALVKYFNLYAQVVLCGRPGDYHSSEYQGLGLGPIIGKRARMKGLVVYDFENDLPRYLRVASGLVREGKLKFKEDHAEGIDKTPAHFMRLMKGENVGKAIVVVGPEKG
ncbi:MAG: NADP-dependent oxidoreductase [Rhodospirillaceae bacterium]|nr:NADP-dependent oxidoreductase [Rhodospirillaceae bacterium]